MGNKLYTNELRQFVWSRNWPKGLLMDITEPDDYIRFTLYRENINALESDAKLQLATVLNETLQAIYKQGVPVHTKVVEGNGREVV